MSRRMTVIFHDEDLYIGLKTEAVKRRLSASDLIAEAVKELLESREDFKLIPIIEESRAEYDKKGGRTWDEVSGDLKRHIEKRAKKK
jgi:hypothetical protein